VFVSDTSPQALGGARACRPLDPRAGEKARGDVPRQVAANEDPQEEAEQQRSQKTVAELCAAYIENHAKRSAPIGKLTTPGLRRRILPRLKARAVCSIVAADIESIHSQVGTQTPYAANHILEVVRNMFNWGKVAGLVPRDLLNPTVGIKWFPERRRRRYITTVEMPEFIRSLEAEDNEYARHGLWLLLLTGLRSIELLKAKWDGHRLGCGNALCGTHQER